MNHRNIDIYTCEHCGREFYSEAECREHEETHTLNLRMRRPRSLPRNLTRLAIMPTATASETALWE